MQDGAKLAGVYMRRLFKLSKGNNLNDTGQCLHFFYLEWLMQMSALLYHYYYMVFGLSVE